MSKVLAARIMATTFGVLGVVEMMLCIIYIMSGDTLGALRNLANCLTSFAVMQLFNIISR
jgi:hypothetical protein